eukprot:CAMPEP_0118955792 /NCGR_PEP_ID=MMETSP1169-20130426/60514_1 /TAXON_ID=36882 /ORGANISM="Pyramimonas obovata, Strain CCMP722" /LENGTH=189 /DNA_ID=CAMNT_0006903695 /DNA_START=29 /DNA_END=594 /DNA_ORIENTATION=+
MAPEQLSDVVHGDLVSFSGYKVDSTGTNAVNTILKDVYPSGDAKPQYAELAVRTAQIASQLKKAGRLGRIQPTLSTSNDFSTRPEKTLPLKDGRFNGLFSKRRALLIGIKYNSSQSFLHPALKASHQDVLETKAFLQQRGFKENDIKVLLDDGSSAEPTSSNILDALEWLVRNTGRKDTLVLHFAGHAG